MKQGKTTDVADQEVSEWMMFQFQHILDRGKADGSESTGRHWNTGRERNGTRSMLMAGDS